MVRIWSLQISIYFLTPRTLLFSNNSPAKRSLLPLKPFHFGATFSINNLCFWGVSFSDSLFSSLFQDDRPKSRFWESFGIQLMAPQIGQVASKGVNLFSRNHINYCAVGTWLLLKGYFSMAIGSFSVFVLRFFVL